MTPLDIVGIVILSYFGIAVASVFVSLIVYGLFVFYVRVVLR